MFIFVLLFRISMAKLAVKYKQKTFLKIVNKYTIRVYENIMLAVVAHKLCIHISVHDIISLRLMETHVCLNNDIPFLNILFYKDYLFSVRE